MSDINICSFCKVSVIKANCKICLSCFCEKCQKAYNDDIILWGKKLSFSAKCDLCKMMGCIYCVETCYTCLNKERPAPTVCGRCRVLKFAECEKDHVWPLCNRCASAGAICGFC